MAMTSETQALLPVTPEDRDAAAQAYHIIAKGYMQVIGCAMEAGAADEKALIQLLARHRISHSLPGDALPKRCDGIEQPAFEEWAKAQGFDLTEHPLHYLFLDAKTDAARQGWAAGLKHASDRMAAALTPSPCPGDGMREARDY